MNDVIEEIAAKVESELAGRMQPSEIENTVEELHHQLPKTLTSSSQYVPINTTYMTVRLNEAYRKFLEIYMQQHIHSREDTTTRVPLKWLNVLPESQMGGILGFTYLGDNSMGRRADLVGSTARMVDIHESIHTPDEYETRVLTDWILEKPKQKYIK